MKKFKMVVLMVVLAFTMIGCEKVPQGNVGVKVFLLGGEKGVEQEVLGVGRYWIGFNEELYLFPTFTQNYVWTQDPAEGSPNDESISFQTSQGLNVGADVGISYSIVPEKVPLIFQKYRKGIDEITDVYMRNMVRDAFVKVASTMKVDKVYGEGKTQMLENIEKLIRSQVEPIGINVEKVYLIGKLRLPSTVIDAINAKINATQEAERQQNKVAQTIAEANKAREEAYGLRDAKIAVAEGEAKRINKIGKALRRNPEVLNYKAVENWDGVLPRFVGGGGAVPFVNIDNFAGKNVTK